MQDENPAEEDHLKMFHPVHTYVSKFVSNFDAVNIHHHVVENGEIIYENPSVQEMQEFAAKNLELLWDEYKRSLNPEEYPVDLSQKCWDNKMRNIQEVKDAIQQLTGK